MLSKKTALSFVQYFIFIKKITVTNLVFIIFSTIFEKGESNEIGL